MLWLWFFAILFLAAPIAKGIGERIGRSGPDPRYLAELRKQFEEALGRVAAAEERVGSLEERVEFYEKLLADPEKMQQARRTLAAAKPPAATGSPPPAKPTSRD
jgi:hypothetical protein